MRPPPRPDNVLNIAEALQQAHAHWNAGQADQTEILCQRVLAVWPGQADALHLLGLMAHAYGKLDLAIAQLHQACQAPRAPAIYSSNLAEMLRQKGMLAEAEEAAQRAVSAEPGLAQAWNNLGIVLLEAGKLEQSQVCLERVAAMQPDWVEAHNNLGNCYRRLSQLDRAEAQYRQALALKPSYASAYSNLASLLCAQGLYDQAAAAARTAIELEPQLVDAYLNLAETEIARHCYDAALAALNALNGFAPGHPKGLVASAQTLRLLDRADEALDYARRAVALVPHHAEAHNALGRVLQHLGQHEPALAAFETAATLPGAVAEEALTQQAGLLLEVGRKEEALAAYERVLTAFPGSLRARVSRADVKTFRAVDDPDILAMQAALAEGARRPVSERTDTQFALAKAYLDCGDAPRGFAHLDAANRQKRASLRYDPVATSAWTRSIATTLSAEHLQQLRGAGAPSELPVFVIGMPRSGTTLIEQILASHPLVAGAGELPTLRRVVESRGPYPQALGTLSRSDMADLGQTYLRHVQPLAQGCRHVVDKMPANFLYAGLIPALLPGARIIHSRRNPVDTCLSCYTKQFAGEQSFSYDQAELGTFYRDYEQLMAHWRSLLPADRFIEVDYEAVVDDLEGQARRLIAFLGLPWDPACLDFHQTQRVVRTASLNQVRQPIYTSSKGRWHQYAAHLGPLLAALGVQGA